MYSLYWETIKKELETLARLDNTIFLGQQVASENFYNLLKDISLDKRYEMPVAEELQSGISTGFALEGYLPISIYQRMDFLPRACDQLVNHLNLLPELSRNLFNPKVIIFTTVGGTKQLDVGTQHNKDLIEGFRLLLTNIPIYDLKTIEEINITFNIAKKCENSIMIIARQNLFYND